ncbi:efflux RND transporter periplasmic adaptor subunit [Sinorhizobium sp. RAC02]|uniref:efflux RND transporter periplasmic adaptor subunit n=1 Tax=Sinorhizobium sp. RAC02 TaxID=1842534 RepID=UPI00083DBE41|nr:efflux RND transporter periplasmic adaptor subunit [Sinorhizobium sp. RAC02]AOF92643.1 efflux transporter, RND family, MFP subunit [Sinorhizobium sp. RAC02]
MNRSVKTTLIVFSLAVAGLVTAFADRQGLAEDAAQPVAAKVVEVAASEVIRLERKAYAETLPINGFLQPARRVTLTAKLSGVLKDVHVDVGDSVRKGDVVASFDDEALKLSLESRAARMEAKAAALTRAETELERARGLAQTGGITKARVIEVETDMMVQKAELRALQAEAAETQRLLNDAVVTAPFDGVISIRRINPGQAISANTELMEIVDTAEMDMVAKLPPAEGTRLHAGQTAQIRIEGLPDQTLSARLARISPATVDGSRSLLIYLRLEKTGAALRGGMFTEGELQLARMDDVLAVPSAAILYTDKLPFVLKIADGKAQRQQVTLGKALRRDGLVEIREGLKEGDMVVTVPLADVKNDTPMTIAQR